MVITGTGPAAGYQIMTNHYAEAIAVMLKDETI